MSPASRPGLPRGRRWSWIGIGAPVLLLLAGACGSGERPPRWTSLASVARVEIRKAHIRIAGIERVEDDAGTWLRQTIRRADWSRAARRGRWRSSLVVRGLGRTADGERTRLRAAGGPAFHRWEGGEEDSENSFFAFGDQLFLDLAPGEEPPERATFDQYLGLREHEPGGPWRVHGRCDSGTGFGLLTGETVTLRFPTGGDGALRATLAVEPLLLADWTADAGDEAAAQVEFTIEADGTEAVRKTLPIRPHGEAVPVEIPLRSAGEHQVVVTLSGDLAAGALLAPVVSPPDPTPSSDSPDVVVFLADTMRRDCVGWQDDAGRSLTPRIDAFRKESVAFDRAWSTGTHTLPAHGSLFTGLLPPQAGLWSHGDALPRSALTLAEVFSAAGYRTAAVTDSVVVSDAYGFAQGFQTFSERNAGLEDTLQRVRRVLAQDDGRPLFLFVHTYAMHTPYDPSREARARMELDPDVRFESLKAALDAGTAEGDAYEAERIGDRLQRLYRAQLVDLDRTFGRFLELLREHGAADGVTLFLSDHGEAFGEHGTYWHGGQPYEEQARIPLLLRAPGLSPATSDTPVSMADVPETLVRLAGVPRPSGWPERTLLSPAGRRVLFTFRAYRDFTSQGSFAVVDWPRKVFLSEQARDWTPDAVDAVFDLAADPDEERAAPAREVPWLERFLERQRPALDAAFQQRVGGASADLDDAKVRELGALGYTHGDH